MNPIIVWQHWYSHIKVLCSPVCHQNALRECVCVCKIRVVSSGFSCKRGPISLYSAINCRHRNGTEPWRWNNEIYNYINKLAQPELHPAGTGAWEYPYVTKRVVTGDDGNCPLFWTGKLLWGERNRFNLISELLHINELWRLKRWNLCSLHYIKNVFRSDLEKKTRPALCLPSDNAKIRTYSIAFFLNLS